MQKCIFSLHRCKSLARAPEASRRGRGLQGAAARRFEATGDEDDDGDRTTGRR